MELVILLAVLAVLVIATLSAVVVSRRRGAGPELEPRPTPRQLRDHPTGAPPAAGPPEVERQAADAGHPPAAAGAPAPEDVPPPPEVAPVGDEGPPPASGATAASVEEPAPAVRPSFRDRLGKARSVLAGYVGSVLARGTVDDETWDELEEALIRADVGVKATTALLDDLRERARAESITDADTLLEALKADLKETLEVGDRSLHYEPGAPNVWLFVGVNGVGKTTTIGKVGKQQREEGRTVVMAAGDTFRAAAAEQLTTWAERAGAELVRGSEGGDPSSVIFDAVQRAGSRQLDLVLADTAGRLHTKVNLMEELSKVRRVADKPPGKVTEVLLVLDATTGQNGLVQAAQFTEAVEVTGVVLTKLDGSAKGGIVVAVQHDLGIPVKLVGLGETVDDLVAFDPDEFVEALFS